MLKAFKIFLTSFPLRVVMRRLFYKVLGIKIPNVNSWKAFFINKQGLEIGGPSALFNDAGYLPIYNIVKSLDGVNFSNSTLWEGKLQEGNHFRFANRVGFQYIAEGSSMFAIKDSSYDFIISSNNLEHIANPIKAVFEWKRIIKENGILLIILPNKKSNFDHKRPYTTFDHLLSDYQNNVGETDATHLQEILALHDLKMDPQAGSFEDFKNRCVNNYKHRGMHHHIFDGNLINEMLHYCGLDKKLFYEGDTCYYVLAVKQSYKSTI